MNQKTDNIFKTKEITGNDTLILVYTATQTNTGRTCLYFFHKTNWNLKKEFNPPHQNLYIVKVKKKMRILKNMQVYPL